MKHLIILSFIAVSLSTHCQTLRETELWIADKFEIFGLKTKEGYVEIHHNYVLDFSEEWKLIIYETEFLPKSQSSTLIIFNVPIPRMKKILYNIKEDRVMVWIQTKAGVSDVINPILKQTIRNEEWNTENISGFSLYFDKKFLEEDMPNRFIKAMNHLIELNGGEI